MPCANCRKDLIETGSLETSSHVENELIVPSTPNDFLDSKTEEDPLAIVENKSEGIEILEVEDYNSIISFNDEEEFKVPLKKVTISEAINRIFEANLKLNKKSISSSSTIRMCSTCSFTLSSLYSFYSKFTNLTQKSSYIHQLLVSSPFCPFKSTEIFKNNQETDPFLNLPSVKIELEDCLAQFVTKKENYNENCSENYSEIEKVTDEIRGDALKKGEERRNIKYGLRMRSEILKKRHKMLKFSNSSAMAKKISTLQKRRGKRPGRKPKIYPNLKRKLEKESEIEDGDEKNLDDFDEIKNEDDLDYSCSHCEKSFVSIKRLRLHELMRHKKRGRNSSKCPKMYECHHSDTCSSLIFSSSSELSSHLISTHAETPGIFTCFKCDPPKAFKAIKHFERHRKIKHSEGLGPEDLVDKTCSICSKNFTIHSQLIAHLKTVHVPEINVECTACEPPKIFPTRNYYRIHYLKAHREGGEKLWDCGLCGKKYKNKNGLEEHHKAKHLNRKDYVCEICGYKTTRKRFLDMHQVIHTDRTKQFQCTTCQQWFLTQRNLVTHQKTHGERDRLCSYCGEAFLHVNSLRRHVQVKHESHSIKEEFTCSQCGKKFKLKEYLMQHLRSKTHGGKGHTAQKRREKAALGLLPPSSEEERKSSSNWRGTKNNRRQSSKKLKKETNSSSGIVSESVIVGDSSTSAKIELKIDGESQSQEVVEYGIILGPGGEIVGGGAGDELIEIQTENSVGLNHANYHIVTSVNSLGEPIFQFYRN